MVGKKDLLYLFDTHIETKEFGRLKIPNVMDMLIHNFNNEQDFISFYSFAFRISKELFMLNDEHKFQVKNFDLFFMRGESGNLLTYTNSEKNEKEDITYFKVLMDSIEYFFDEAPVYYQTIQSIGVGKYFINRSNFDALSDIILKMFNLEKYEVEEEPTFENEQQKQVYILTTEGRRKQAEKNREDIDTIIKIIQYGGKSYIPYEEIKKMTILQMYDAYFCTVVMSNWNENYEQYLVGQEPKNLDLTHWRIKFKNISNEKY